MNLSRLPLKKDTIVKDCVIVELTREILKHLYGVLNDIMSPIC